MKRFLLIVAILFFAAPAFACARPTPGAGVRVGVSVAPQKYFVDQISGGSVEVQVLIPTGANPHAYEPGPEQLRMLSDLAVFFAQGLEFEAACLRRLRGMNPELRVVELGPGDSASGHEHAHDHVHANPHTWLSPRLVRMRSDVILKTLRELQPERAAQFAENHRKFGREIQGVDDYIRGRLAGVRGRLFIVYHPSWEFFARDYGLRMLVVHDDGHEPSARDMMRLVQAARAAGVRTIFAEPGFDRRPVEVIAEDIGAQIKIIDPLAADWAENLRASADRIAEGLAQ